MSSLFRLLKPHYFKVSSFRKTLSLRFCSSSLALNPLLSSNLPKSVKIVEVGPRDGLQNEPITPLIPTTTKVDLINRLSETGLTHIESGAFVSPKWIPQMSNSLEVFRNISRNPNVTYSAILPNLEGFTKAIEADVDEIAIFTAASESFCKANINRTIKESIDMFEPVCNEAKKLQIPVRGYVSCVLGCPIEGKIDPIKVGEVASLLFNDLGCHEISLGDTIGIGNPQSTLDMLKQVNKSVPIENIAVHFHNTYGQALSNLLLSLQYGINIIDSSISGLGGCPYANGATGNVATEDVVYMLNGLGIESNIDINKLMQISVWISNRLDKKCSSSVTRAIKSHKLSRL